jgi:hypothetical protein
MHPSESLHWHNGQDHSNRSASVLPTRDENKKFKFIHEYSAIGSVEGKKDKDEVSPAASGFGGTSAY